MVASSGKEAVANGRAVTRYDQGYCQQYVRGPCWEVGSLYGSAIEAWNGARQKHPGDRNPPNGAPCYYRGGQYGHAVISVGGGRIRSTDCTSATYVNDAALSWPESAWGYEYLGWTGDINGVDLPLEASGGGGEPEEEDMPEYSSASSSDRTVKTGDWRDVVWETSNSDRVAEGEAGVRIGGQSYVATLWLTVEGVAANSTIRTRHVEVGESSGGGYDDVQETGRVVEHLGTGGSTYLQDTRSGRCGSDRRFRFQVNVPTNATISARLELLAW